MRILTAIERRQAKIIPIGLGLLFLAFLVYLFLLCFPVLHFLISPGVDSWTYALSHLSETELSFGKDIIYTYGPLGYLVSGSVLPENYQEIIWFKTAVHSIFLGLCAIQFLKIKSIRRKLFWVFSFFCVYHSLIAIDYLLVLGFLLLLSWSQGLRGKMALAIALFLGGFAGLCTLIKFTAGVMTFGALVMCWFGRLYEAYSVSDRRRRVQEEVVFLLTAMAAAMAVTFVGLHHSLGMGLLRLVPSLAIALIWGGVSSRFLRSDRRSSIRPLLGWSSSPAIFGLTLAIVILLSDRPSMLGFVLGSLQVSSGYSSAMSLVGSAAELGLAIAIVVILLTIFVRLVTPQSLGILLALTFILWVVLKHGFVRQDAHVFMFFFVSPFLLSIALQQRPRFQGKPLAVITMTLMVAIAGIYWQVPQVFGQPKILWNISLINQPKLVFNRVVYFDFSRVLDEVQVASNDAISPLKLADEALTYLETKTVDVIPWELSLIPANQLNWQPRRTLQSYTNYTEFLDTWTAEGLAEQPPEAILYDFTGLDGRHPFFSEPATFFHVLTHYQISPQFPEFVPTELMPNLMLLETRDPPRVWLEAGEARQRSLSWNESMTLDVGDGDLLRAAIAIKESFIGKVMKTLLRAAPVRMQVNYQDGTEATYRILPTTSENGVILSHLPRSPEEGLAFWTGLETPDQPLPAPVASISFVTDNPMIYRPRIELDLQAIALEPPSQSGVN